MLTRNEVEEIKKEAEEIVKKRQKEEKRDLWELWDKIGKDTVRILFYSASSCTYSYLRSNLCLTSLLNSIQ